MGKRKISEMFYHEDSYTEQYFKDYLAEYKEDLGLDWEEDNVTDYCDWCNTMQEMDFDDMIYRIKHSHINTYKAVIVGGVGTWRGRFEIEPTFCGNLVDAIYKCIDGCEIRRIERVGNSIEVDAYHHDGSNSFTILLLSHLGELRYWRNGDVSIKNRENLLKFPQYIYSSQKA